MREPIQRMRPGITPLLMVELLGKRSRRAIIQGPYPLPKGFSLPHTLYGLCI